MCFAIETALLLRKFKDVKLLPGSNSLFYDNKTILWYLRLLNVRISIPVAARFCGGLLDGILRSKPAGGMEVCLLKELCVVEVQALRLAHYSSIGVLPSVVCLECDREASIMRWPWPITGCCAMGEKVRILRYQSSMTYITLYYIFL
jgi:hypothetical protein